MVWCGVVLCGGGEGRGEGGVLWKVWFMQYRNTAMYKMKEVRAKVN